MLRMALRGILHYRGYAALFVLAVGISISSLVTILALQTSLSSHLEQNARELAAADLTLEGSEEELTTVEGDLRERWPEAEFARKTEAISMILPVEGETAVQAMVTVVEGEYPLYGSVTSGSGEAVSRTLEPGEVIVDPELLVELGIAAGDTIRVGTLELMASDTIANRTDAAFSFFRLAPPLFMTKRDFDSSGLDAPGARLFRSLQVKLPDGVIVSTVFAELRENLGGTGVRVESWAEDEPGMSRMLRRGILFFFITALVSLFLGVLAIVAVTVSLLSSASREMAILRAIGVGASKIGLIWGSWILILALAGNFLGAILSHFHIQFLVFRLGDVLPAEISVSTPQLLLFSTLVSMVALIGTVPFVKAIASLAPRSVLSSERLMLSRGSIAGTLLFLIVVSGMILIVRGTSLADVAISLGAVVAVLALLGGVVVGAQQGVRNLAGRLSSVAARIALRGPGAARSVLAGAAVGLALGLLLLIHLLELNVVSGYLDAFPSDAPNVYFMNLQPGQEDGFDSLVRNVQAENASFYPLVRGRIINVNDRPVADLEREARRERGGGDRLTREFGFTFGRTLPPTDRFIDGDTLFRADVTEPQVSIYSGHHERYGIGVGDRITISAIGRRTTAVVSSIREIDRSRREPFFYFIFEPSVFQEAPYTVMGGMNLDEKVIPGFESRMASDFPNVTMIDIHDIVVKANELIDRLTAAVRLLAVSALISGVILMFGVFGTVFLDFRREVALYRVVGASRSSVFRILLLRFLLLSVVIALIGLIIGEGAYSAVSYWGLELEVNLYFGTAVLWMALASMILFGIAAVMSFRALRTEPWSVLRSE